jgi:hypothetical protein
MPKRHPLDGVRNARWFCEIELVRFAVRNRTIRARAGADVAENHEGRRSVMPALADVRTACLLADGVELQLLHHAFQAEIILGPRSTHLEPRGLRLAGTDELNRRFDHPFLV